MKGGKENWEGGSGEGGEKSQKGSPLEKTSCAAGNFTAWLRGIQNRGKGDFGKEKRWWEGGKQPKTTLGNRAGKKEKGKLKRRTGTHALEKNSNKRGRQKTREC